MELRNVKTFIKIAEIGNFSKAATELGYAQSTVTMQIQTLERELGVSLFERNFKITFLQLSTNNQKSLSIGQAFLMSYLWYSWLEFNFFHSAARSTIK